MNLTRIGIVVALLLPLAGMRAQEAPPPAAPMAAPENSKATQGAAPASEAAAGRVLTLEQCLEAALSKSDSAAILQKNLDISQAQYRQTVAKNAVSLNAGLGTGAIGGFGSPFLLSQNATTVGTSVDSSTDIPLNYSGFLSLNGPSTSLSLSGGGSFSTPPVESIGFNAGTFSLSLTQTVWDGYPGGIARANVQQGLLGLQSAQLATDANKLTLAYQIKQAYFSMLTAQRNLDVYAQNLELQKSALEQEEALYKLQQAVDVDLQTAQINVESADVDQRSGQIALVSARKALANLVGLTASEEFSVAETADPQVSVQSLEEAIAIGLDKRVELKQLDVSRRIGAISLGLIKAQTSPTVSVSGTGYLLNAVNLYPSPNQNVTAMTIGLGGKVSMPILDSGSAEYQREANRYQDSVYDLQDDQLRRSISLAIENDYEAVQLQTKKLDLAKLTAANSKGQYDLRNVQRQYGTATNQDVLAAAVVMVNANTALETARNALELAILQLQNDMGL
jgi:cobalt-zinc-cadmium efflux system outer membrane protein